MIKNELIVAVAHGQLQDHLPRVIRGTGQDTAWKALVRGVQLPELVRTEITQQDQMSFVLRTTSLGRSLNEWVTAAALAHPSLDIVLRVDGKVAGAFHKGRDLAGD